MNSSKGQLMIFSRTPEMGAVKTRLQPLLGARGCLKLHQSLTKRAIDTAMTSELAEVTIWHTGNDTHPFWRDQIERVSNNIQSLGFAQQYGDGLGVRMQNAFKVALGASDWAILIGSDCPEIDTEYLREAATILDSGASTVIGPAEDGGYVLIGLRKPSACLFENIDWGTASVLEQTLARAEEHDIAVNLLKQLRDIDTESDYHYYFRRYPDYFCDQNALLGEYLK